MTQSCYLKKYLWLRKCHWGGAIRRRRQKQLLKKDAEVTKSQASSRMGTLSAPKVKQATVSKGRIAQGGTKLRAQGTASVKVNKPKMPSSGIKGGRMNASHKFLDNLMGTAKTMKELDKKRKSGKK